MRGKTTLVAKATVEGPQMEPHGSPSITAALSKAQYRACHHGCAATWLIRDEGGTIRFHVTRHVDGTVITSEIGESDD